jgi:hypothetical protein
MQSLSQCPHVACHPPARGDRLSGVPLYGQEGDYELDENDQPGRPLPRRYFFAPSPVIRARAIFPIYAKITVALVRAACHHAPMKIYE